MSRVAGDSGRNHAMNVKIWLLAFLAAAALHVLLALLFRPLPHHPVETRPDWRYTLFLSEKDLIRGAEDPYGLRYWLRYSDPELLVKPDRKYGFSVICARREESLPEPAAFRHGLFEALSGSGVSGSRLPDPRGIADLCPGIQDWIGVRSKPVKRAFTAAAYPIWTDEQGAASAGLFRPDPAELQLLTQERAPGRTLLRLMLEKGRPPAVKIVRSCGNPKLDLLAKRQLLVRRENFSGHPWPQEKYFMVAWQTLTLKSSAGEGKK